MGDSFDRYGKHPYYYYQLFFLPTFSFPARVVVSECVCIFFLFYLFIYFFIEGGGGGEGGGDVKGKEIWLRIYITLCTSYLYSCNAQ